MDFINLKGQYLAYKNDIDRAISSCLDNAEFIGGKSVKMLEDALSDRLNMHTIATSNGTDALILALEGIKAKYNLKEGDEVITSDFSFFASAEAIARVGLKVKFVDIKLDDFNLDLDALEGAINEKTKVIIPVSLYGQTCDFDKLDVLAKKYNLVVLEDACQSFGARYKDRPSCALSPYAATSFFPSKPLGCYGDGGAIFVKNEDDYKYIKAIANHGAFSRYYHDFIGYNARLDSIQAAILLVKLAHLDDELEARANIAKKYDKAFENIEEFKISKVKDYAYHAYAQYTILFENVEFKNKIIKAFTEANIPYAVHYPLPLHSQKAFSNLNCKDSDFAKSVFASQNVLSLPFSPFLENRDFELVVNTINNTFKR